MAVDGMLSGYTGKPLGLEVRLETMQGKKGYPTLSVLRPEYDRRRFHFRGCGGASPILPVLSKVKVYQTVVYYDVHVEPLFDSML